MRDATYNIERHIILLIPPPLHITVMFCGEICALRKLFLFVVPFLSCLLFPSNAAAYVDGYW